MTRYPNLLELHRYHPYGEPAICGHGEIEPELLRAVLEDGEPLLPAEIGGIARLYGVPRGLLECRKAVMLDMGRRRHAAMAVKECVSHIQLQHMAQDGNQDAVKYLAFAEWRMERFLDAVRHNSLSYCHYLGIKKVLLDYISFSTPRPKRRGYGGQA